MSGVSQLSPVDSSSGSEAAHSTSPRVKSSATRLNVSLNVHTPLPSSSSLSSIKMIRQKKSDHKTREKLNTEKKRLEGTSSESATASTLNTEEAAIKKEKELSESAALPEKFNGQPFIAKLKELKKPTFNEFFRAVSQHVELSVPLTQRYIVGMMIRDLTRDPKIDREKKTDHEVIQVLLEGDILFRPCVDRWKRINAILQVYRTHIEKKTLDSQTDKIQQLQVHLNFLIQLQQKGGVEDLMKHMDTIPPKYKFKEVLLLGFSKDQNEQSELIGLLRVTMSELQENLARLHSARSSTLDTRTLSRKESLEEKGGYKSPAPTPELPRKIKVSDRTGRPQQMRSSQGTQVLEHEIKARRKKEPIEGKEKKAPVPSGDIPRKRKVSEGLVSGSGSSSEA